EALGLPPYGGRGARRPSSCEARLDARATEWTRGEGLMAVYAVVDPATGETVKEYPTISDDELRGAIARADETHREWSESTTVKVRAGLIRGVGALRGVQRQGLAEGMVRGVGEGLV